MTSKKKKIAVVALVLCLVAILSMGTLAYFSASDSIDNTLNFVDDFSMDLYETDENGETIVDTDGETTIGQTYDDLTPGQSIHKDPTVVNKSSTVSQYIRVKVTLDNATDWAAIVTAGSNLTSIFTGFDSNAWTRYDAPETDTNADTITYTFYLNSTLDPGATATLFTGVTIPSSMTADQATTIGTTIITIDADAIQASDLGDGITTTKDAFDLVEGN